MKPANFDLTVSDLAAARRFVERVFGWRFEDFPMPYEYYRIQAGPSGESGIDGGMGAVKDAPLAAGRPTTQVTIPVPNLDEVLAQVTRNGGKIMEAKIPIPGIGWYATCAEPGGLMFGVMVQARKYRSSMPAMQLVTGTVVWSQSRKPIEERRSPPKRCLSVLVASPE